MTPKPEHLTLDELERMAYINADTERAALYARLSEAETGQRERDYDEGYDKGYEDGYHDGITAD